MAERFGKGTVDRVGDLWVLHLKGTPFERGLQHGTLMRYRVREMIEFYRMLPDTLAARLMPGDSFKLRALKRLKGSMIKKLSRNRAPEAVEEMRGLAVGLGMQAEDLTEAFVLADVLQKVGSLAERKRRAGPPVLPGFGCTSAVRETPGGGLIFGRNFDFWGAGYWDTNPAVIFHHPDQGRAFCSIGTAGIPTGGVTAINEDGLAVAIHQHGSRDSSLKGTPIIDIMHSVVREASTVSEALDVASRYRATGGWSLVVAGGSAEPRAAVLEMSSARQSARFFSEHALAASNFFLDEELSSRELQSNLSSTLSDHARYNRALDLASDSRMTVSRMAGLLSDHFDPFSETERSAGLSISRITTLSSVIFSLHDGRFWVSESPAPSSKGGYVGFELEAEFEGRRSAVARLEGGKPPGMEKTAAQDRYLEAYREYIQTGDLNRVLIIVSECASMDPGEASFPLMEGILRAMLGNFRGALTGVERALELEGGALKKKVAMLWRARVLDLLERRDDAVAAYAGLAEDPETPSIVSKPAAAGRRRPFEEKNLSGLMLDFTNSDTLG